MLYPAPSQSSILENALRILHPAQKKLSSVEAQRVMAVVDEALSKLERALSLTYLSQSMDRFSVALGAEVVCLMKDYTKLCEEYIKWYEVLETSSSTQAEVLSQVDSAVSSQHVFNSQQVASQSSMRSGSVRLESLDRGEDEGVGSRFYTVQTQLRHTCKSLLRFLAGSPSAEGVLREAEAERRSAVKQLMDSMHELRGIMHEKLLTSKMEDVKRREHLTVVTEQQKMADSKITQLEAELMETQRQKHEEVSRQ